MSRQEVIDAAVWAVERAKRHVDYIEFSAEDASRSDIEYMIQVFGEVIAAGAVVCNVPDTTGYAVPGQLRELFRTLQHAHAGRRPHHLEHAQPQRPRPGGGQLAGRGRGRRAPGRVHDQRHRRARRQHVDGRGGDGARHAPRPLRRDDAREHEADLPGQPDAVEDDRRRDLADQARGGRQRLRARGRHPPGRHDEEQADLRDHASRVGGAPEQLAGARQAFGPPRLRRAPARARHRPRARRRQRRVRALQGPGRQEEGRLRRGPVRDLRRGQRRRGALRAARRSRCRRRCTARRARPWRSPSAARCGSVDGRGRRHRRRVLPRDQGAPPASTPSSRATRSRASPAAPTRSAT